MDSQIKPLIKQNREDTYVIKCRIPSRTAELPVSYKLGPRWDGVITWSNFKSEVIFGFLSPNYTGYDT